MQYFFKFYYQNRNKADAEYDKRLNAPSVVVLPLEIQPMDLTEKSSEKVRLSLTN